jgi:hypothetical protein
MYYIYDTYVFESRGSDKRSIVVENTCACFIIFGSKISCERCATLQTTYGSMYGRIH